jgi:hypothetical protein
MSKPTDDADHRAEAERLATLPREVQAKALALIRAPADDPNVSKRDRDAARQRADALNRQLGRLNRRRKKS